MTAPGGVDAVVEFFLGLQVFGTPEQCHDQIVANIERTGGDTFNGVFSYAGMPIDAAEASMRLFAREVMPALKEIEPLSASAAQPEARLD